MASSWNRVYIFWVWRMKSESDFDFYRHDFRISLSMYIFSSDLTPEALKPYTRFWNRSFSVYFSSEFATDLRLEINVWTVTSRLYMHNNNRHTPDADRRRQDRYRTADHTRIRFIASKKPMIFSSTSAMVSSRLRSSAEAADRAKWSPGHRGVPAGRLAELGVTKSTQ